MPNSQPLSATEMRGKLKNFVNYAMLPKLCSLFVLFYYVSPDYSLKTIH
jgi:hypothetical protein